MHIKQMLHQPCHDQIRPTPCSLCAALALAGKSHLVRHKVLPFKLRAAAAAADPWPASLYLEREGHASSSRRLRLCRLKASKLVAQSMKCDACVRFCSPGAEKGGIKKVCSLKEAAMECT